MPEKRWRIVLGLVTLVALALLFYPAFNHLATGMEEGALLVYPELIQKGLVPYRDFETFYGPANLWLLCGAYELAGAGIYTERAVGLFYRLAICGALFLFLQTRGRWVATGAVFIAAVVLLPTGLAAFAWIGALMCALWSLYLLSASASKICCAFAGLLGGGALLFRPDFAPAFFAATLPLWLARAPSGRLRYGLGAAVALLPYPLLAIVAGPRNLFDNLFLYPVVYSSPARHVPILAAQPDVLALFALHLAVVTAAIVAASIVLWRNRADLEVRLLLSLALLALGLTHQAAQRLDYGHLVSTLALSLPILGLGFALGGRLLWPRNSDFWSAAAGVTAVLSVLFLVAPRITNIATHELREELSPDEHPGAIFLEHDGRIYPVASKAAGLDTARVLRQLKEGGRPNDRLFVGPSDLSRTNYNDTYLYFLAQPCRPATYFLEMNPGSANRPHSRLARDIATADWLVLTHEADDWHEPNNSDRSGPDTPNRVVEREFQLVARYGTFDVYRRHAFVAVAP